MRDKAFYESLKDRIKIDKNLSKNFPGSVKFMISLTID